MFPFKMISAKMKTKKIICAGGLLGIILFFGFLAFFFNKETSSSKLPVLGELQDFFLYDSHGDPVHREQLQGKVWVADFIFTSCSGICPVMTRNMAKLHRIFLENDQVRFVSISVNPETDSSEILARYARKHNADTPRWYFLTGPREAIQSLSVKSFKIGSVEDPIFHSDRFVLVDPQMRIRGYYNGTQEKDLEILMKDILILLEEKSS